MKLRFHRSALGLSQSKLARLAGVSRFKICTFELGNGSLTAGEKDRIRQTLAAEADRLRRLPDEIELGTKGDLP
jgi:predicted transcriptional regulator